MLKVRDFKPRHVNEDAITIATNFRICSWDRLLNKENWSSMAEVGENSLNPQPLSMLSISGDDQVPEGIPLGVPLPSKSTDPTIFLTHNNSLSILMICYRVNIKPQ